uniref:Liner plasmid accessory protein n=1 Tax=Agaricus bisporus var. bisporus (strain H97 / ATCC MYA-4626 / FGSC 10389) TaxID=936046 RepID=S4SN26_AGABB|nr:liner plasmid accessory protein [Agaricus bisporus var. bisporus H97]
MTADGYRRQVLYDIANKEKLILNLEVKPSNENSILEFSKEYKILTSDEMRKQQENLKTYLKDTYNLTFESLALEADKQQNFIEENKIETEKANIQKVESIQKELDNIMKSDIGDVFWVAYNKYSDFLDTLRPDKIVCVFNIFILSMTLSSFFSVLSIMLSENIINRISFLDKYPRILKLLKLRNNINRKISKFHLCMLL